MLSSFKGAGIVAMVLTLAACSSGTDSDSLRRDLGIGAGLPTAYPLLPGDAALWQGMTAAQRERALLFLQDGSTVASSLKPD
jgi:hypothetical protein